MFQFKNPFYDLVFHIAIYKRVCANCCSKMSFPSTVIDTLVPLRSCWHLGNNHSQGQVCPVAFFRPAKVASSLWISSITKIATGSKITKNSYWIQDYKKLLDPDTPNADPGGFESRSVGLIYRSVPRRHEILVEISTSSAPLPDFTGNFICRMRSP